MYSAASQRLTSGNIGCLKPMIFKAPKLLLVFFTFINFIYPQQPQHSNKVIGYYAQWAIYARDYNVLDIEAKEMLQMIREKSSFFCIFFR